jgi:hypothetical protein
MTRGYKRRKDISATLPNIGNSDGTKVQGVFPTPSSPFMRKQAMNVHMDNK